MLNLSTAQTDAEFADVYRFWYDVYVTEMGRHQDDPNALHHLRQLRDPLATAGSLSVARRDGTVVGTVLSTAIDHPAAAKYRELYGLSDLSREEQWSSAITTKLMVTPGLRHTRLPFRLAFATFDWGLRVGIKHNYIDCNDHLLRLFTRLGYEPHLPALHHKDYGAVNSLRLNITDEAHLRRVGSPFLAVLRRYQADQGITPPQRPTPARVSYAPVREAVTANQQPLATAGSAH